MTYIICSPIHFFTSINHGYFNLNRSKLSDIRQEFFAKAVFCGTIFYSLSITIYFLIVVKFGMSEAKIKKYIEPFLHAVPIMYILAVSTYIYATSNYNSVGTTCWTAPKPINCQDDPEVECLSSGNSDVLRWVGGGIPIIGVFFGNCTMLAVIGWTYRS